MTDRGGPGSLPLGRPPALAWFRAGARGQAAVELIALLPVAVVAALAGAQLLAAGAAREAAAQAAAAGAGALLQRADPHERARAAAGVRADRLRVRVTGRRVEVHVRPRAVLPGLGRRLEARATADAGPSAGDGPR